MTPWAIAHQALLCVEFSRQKYWRGLPFPFFFFAIPFYRASSWPRIEPESPTLQADSLWCEPQEPKCWNWKKKKKKKKKSHMSQLKSLNKDLAQPNKKIHTKNHYSPNLGTELGQFSGWNSMLPLPLQGCRFSPWSEMEVPHAAWCGPKQTPPPFIFSDTFICWVISEWNLPLKGVRLLF